VKMCAASGPFYGTDASTPTPICSNATGTELLQQIARKP
jgi:hypothetical protein